MTFVYTEWMRNLVGHDRYPALPNFEEPRSIAPLGKPVEKCTIGILTSAGVQLASDPPLGAHNDLSYRTIPRSVEFSDLILRHTSPSRKWAEQDLNVVYPRDPLLALEHDGFIGALAERAVSILGSIFGFSALMLETAPRIADEFQAQGVDLVFLLPLCPWCHRCTGLIARALEARGLPTVMMHTLLEMAEAFKPPRPVFLDFPVGCSAGRPNDPEAQKNIVKSSLALAPQLGTPWRVATLPFEWSADGSRAWEADVRALYMSSLDRFKKGLPGGDGSLEGEEHEFTIRCAC